MKSIKVKNLKPCDVVSTRFGTLEVVKRIDKEGNALTFVLQFDEDDEFEPQIKETSILILNEDDKDLMLI